MRQSNRIDALPDCRPGNKTGAEKTSEPEQNPRCAQLVVCGAYCAWSACLVLACDLNGVWSCRAASGFVVSAKGRRRRVGAGDLFAGTAAVDIGAQLLDCGTAWCALIGFCHRQSIIAPRARQGILPAIAKWMKRPASSGAFAFNRCVFHHRPKIVRELGDIGTQGRPPRWPTSSLKAVLRIRAAPGSLYLERS
jgi:hypothetical protein